MAIAAPKLNCKFRRRRTLRLGWAKRGELCLAGRIPLRWLEAAAGLPGKSLHTGIALWFAAGQAKSAKIPLSNVAGCRFGLDRNSKYRALDWLEGAGLISVERRLGKTPIVTILRPEPPS
jgi:hypothetical protein